MERESDMWRASCTVLLLLSLVWPAACEWPLENPIDPARCDPRCPAGQRCHDARCVPDTDGAVDTGLLDGNPPTSGTVSTLAGTGDKGFVDGKALSAKFYYPGGIEVDSKDQVYVADTTNNRIRMIANGSVWTHAGTGKASFADGALLVSAFRYPYDLAMDTKGKLHIADYFNHRVRATFGSQVTTVAGSGTAGFTDGKTTTAQFNKPSGIALDGQGKIYVADYFNHRVRAIWKGQVTTLAGDGTKGFKDGPALSARFHFPHGLAVGSKGEVYVADTNNHRIRKISGGQVSTVAGSGTEGFKDGPALSAMFAVPRGVALDSAGRIYVADSNNHRVRLISGGNVSTLAGSGTAGYKDGPASTAQLWDPYDVALDSKGRVYVADRKNHLIRLITP